MAFDKTPTSWITDWSEDGTDITVPISSFSELTAAEADAANGDIRKIMFAIVEHIWQTYNALASADRPTKMTMTKRATVNTTYNKITSAYQFTFETDIGTQEVRDESSSSSSSSPSSSPSASVSNTPSSSPSATSSSSPSASVSNTPSTSPSASVSNTPSSSVSNTPSSTPSSSVSNTPSATPSATPSTSPSAT